MNEMTPQQKARAKYEGKNRKGIAVTVRFTDEQGEFLDAVRGDLSRPEFLRQAIGLRSVP